MHLFVSHASSDRLTAEHVAGYMERRGITCWMAPRDVPGGADWDAAIAEAIRGCSGLLLLFSADADESRHVGRELHLADRARKPIYPVRLARIEPHKLQYLLTQIQWIDWLDGRDRTLERLAQHISGGDEDTVEPERDTSAELGLTRRQRTDESWPWRTLAFRTDREAATAAARIVTRHARSYPEETVLLPTGRTSTAIFRSMVHEARQLGRSPFGDAFLMNDTETFGVWPGHATSRANHVQTALVDRLGEEGLGPTDSQVRLLSGLITEADPIVEARRFLRLHPPSVHCVSVAPTGEVIGYEAATYDDPDEVATDGCGVIEVGQKGRDYIDPNQPSRSIVSVGMATSLSARTLVIPILDAAKERVTAQMCHFVEQPGIPASLLRRHPSAVMTTTWKIAEEAGLDSVTRWTSPEEAVDQIADDLGLEQA